GNFIVVFKKGITPDQITEYIDQVNESGGEVTHRFDPDILNGFSAKLTPESLQSFQSLTGDVIDYVGVYTPKSGRHAQLIVVI
ncbi:hypothetical protein K443DRAFT_114263, partial [Laccaria amethystina LaAM-08-1]